MEIICIEKISGERIISEVEKTGNKEWVLNNPLTIHISPDGTKIGFAPCLLSDPKKMVAKIHTQCIAMEHIPGDEIVNAYVNYVSKLTSSIIQLDKTIKPIQLNG